LVGQGEAVGSAFLGVSEGIDPAVAIVRDGRVLAFMEEERLLRYKHAKDLYPFNALKYCLWQADVRPEDIAAIAVHADVPAYSDGRMAEFYRQMAEKWPLDPRTLNWQRARLARFSAKAVETRHARAWRRSFGMKPVPKIHAIPQHYVHALHAFMQSPFDDALCLTIDGSGDQHCTVLWSCKGDQIQPIHEIAMPHSLGWFYAAFTEYLGFEAHDGEYKMMGLSVYGRPNASIKHKVGQVLREAVDGPGYVADPSYLHYGEHTWSDRHTDKLVELFGRTPRHPDDKLDEWHHDLAYAVQDALQRAVERLVRWGIGKTGSKNVCLGGGVALNVNLCTHLAKLDCVEGLFPHPLSGDSGAAAGVALGACWRETGKRPEKLRTLALGNEQNDGEIRIALERCRIAYERPNDIAEAVAAELAKGAIVGWFQGRMEAGPRALGQRSILADPRTLEARDRVNNAIKNREYWRPFCPSMTAESAGRYLTRPFDAPFMTLAFDANETMKREAPAVVHRDGTTRVQTVHSDEQPLYHRLLRAFETLTGVPVLLNTSFNLKGEPIVCTITDAIRTFYASGLDVLAAGNFLIRKQ
jgi:carbamoyltransferase